MTQDEFIKVLDKKRYSYEIEGDKIVVTHKGVVYLDSITSLPPGVEFSNGGGVDLNSLASLPPGVVFMNGGRVDLRSLTSLPPGVEFNNKGNVYKGDDYKGDVYLGYLIGIWFDEWNGNIEGIDSKRLLNKMIKDGIFER
jgi:hypothetical protein